MKEFTKTNYHYFFFIVLLFIQFTIYDDYGFPNDEEISRENGLIAYNYLLDILNISFLERHPNLPLFNDYNDRYYGSIFELFLVFIEKIFLNEDLEKIYLTRHLFISIFFFVSSIYFYLILRKFFSKNISLIGVLMFIIHPRIFSQSFYNSKDIIFLVFFCISNFYLINFFLKQSLRNILLLSFFAGLTISIRPMGVIIPILFLFFFVMQNIERNKIKKLSLILIFFLSTFVFSYLFWPYLWEDPLNIISSLKKMSKFDWIGEVFFNGEYHIAKYMPWYYVPLTILTTTPIFIILSFFIGFFIILKKFFFNLIELNNDENIWKNILELNLLYSLIIIFLTIIFIIELNATIYTGWRQLYFIYPSIIFICIYGIDFLFKNIKFKKIICVILFSSIILNVFWIIKNHPYQYVFYNSLITKKNIKNFEQDYYGVSNLQILKKLFEIKSKNTFKVYIFSVNPYHLSLNMINNRYNKEILFVNDISQADYIITNHFYQKYYFRDKKLFADVHPIEVERYLKDNFKLIYEIKSNGVSINSIYSNK